MGIYLASPNKEKHSFDDSFANMKVGSSDMQGYPIITFPLNIKTNNNKYQAGE